MPAQVETMFYVKETPWHGLGTKLDGSPLLSQAIDASGLDWDVGLKRLVTVDGESVAANATYRKSDGSILGVVGPRYLPLQNRDAFNWFQPFIDSGLASLHTAGSLFNGKKVWVLAEIQREQSEIVPGDSVAKFILLSNSHDGSTAIRVGFTPIRVVCANTLAAAHSKLTSKLIRIRHTVSSKINLEMLRSIMDVINSEFEATAEQYRFLASRNFNKKDIAAYVKRVLGVSTSEDLEIPTRTKNIMDEIMSKIEGGIGQENPSVTGTWWAAYNGVTEYLSYSKGRNAQNRIDSLWFGPAGNQNYRALELALEFSNAA
jgi:phage/plasmid-like protein (TIGR03299 family)